MRNKLVVSLGCLAAALVFSPALRASSSICDGISGNLVVNCGFEAGFITGVISATGNVPSWTLTRAAVGSTFNLDTDTPNSGNWDVQFGAVDNEYDTLSQSIATIHGQSYTLSFYLYDLQGDGPDFDTDFQALWDGTSLLDQYTTTSGYVEYSYTVLGGASGSCRDGCSDTLTFEGYNYPAAYELDDVSLVPGAVAATPEPSSLLLMGSGLVGLAGMLRRRFV